MPYRYREDLPHSVQNSLPRPAQDIYIDVFNSAWDEYARPQDRRGRWPGRRLPTTMKNVMATG